MKKTEPNWVIYYKDFIKNEIASSGRTGGVVGVSGGIDSAVCLYLTNKAVGKDNTHPVFLPHRKNSEDIKKKAVKIVEKLNLKLKIYDLRKIIENFKNETGCADKMQIGNFAARVRTAFLYQEAARTDSLVINTSNRTESMTGYFTKWGDEGGDVSPLGNLYKKDVYDLATQVGVPEDIIKSPPSAGFYSSQNDEDELGLDYKTLDRVLMKIDGGKEEEIASGLLNKVKKLIDNSAHKRDKPVTAPRIN
ncbi:MAG: NAD+ synthase [Elusimicrobiota bacterium]